MFTNNTKWCKISNTKMFQTIILFIFLVMGFHFYIGGQAVIILLLILITCVQHDWLKSQD